MCRLTIFHGIAAYIVIIPCLSAQNSAWTIGTFAGTDRPVKDGGPGISSLLNTPGSVVLDAGGNVIFADTNNHRVRKISTNGTIATIVGTGAPGNSGDSGPALTARMISPQGLALDAAGDLYISDYAANVVRMVSPTGIITTVAGNGLPGNTGNGGKATSASLDGPYALALDSAGNLYIAEDLNNAVRKVTPGGTITAFTTSPVGNPEGLAFDSTGALYIAAWGDDKIYKASPTGALTVFAGNGNEGYSGDGGPATSAMLAGPQGIAFDASGTLWICDSINNRIRNISGGSVPGATIQSVIGSGYSGLSPIGNVPSSVSVYLPVGVAVDAKGTVYWSESGNHRIREYVPSNHGVIELAGYTPALNTTAAPTSLLLFNPFGTATDASGNVYIADTSDNVIRKITPAGVSSVIAGTGNANFNGDIGTATSINLTAPEGVSVDAQGNIYVADTGNGRIRRINPAGQMLTIMGAGSALPLTGTFDGNAFLFYPTGVVATGNGTFVVVDEYFGIVAMVNSVGTITLIPTANVGYLGLPIGIAVSGSNVYIADTFDNRILKYNGTTTSVFAGTGAPGFSGDNGPANKATLFFPYAVAVDANNNVYIADTYNSAIRMVDTTGKITTIAGMPGMPGFSGDGGLAANAQIFFPTGLNVDGSGNIEVTDNGNQRVRILKYQAIPADLTIQPDSTTKSANHGSSTVIQLSLASMGGFAGSANIVATAPSGITVQFTPTVPVTITAGQTVVVAANVQIPAATATGAYTISFALTAGAIAHTVSVTLNVTNLPQFTSAGVVSAASFAGGGVSPGEIVAIFGQDMGPASVALGSFANGQLSTQAGGTQVTFGGVAAPIVYSLAGQVSAIVPYEVTGPVTQVQITYNGQTSPALPVAVVPAAPGIFTLPGGSQAAALNADLSVNGAGNPAAKGSVVVLFATGEGQTNPGGVDGRLATTVFPAPQLPVTVTIGGQTAQILYAGAAPYEVAGVLQINVMVPSNIPSGAAQVSLQVGTQTSGGSASIVVQ